MDWWEDWLAGIVGPDMVFPVTLGIVTAICIVVVVTLSGPKGRP
jgi:hypothetical protein